MIPKDKINELRKKLRKGYPQGELMNDLSSDGYTSDEIREAMYNLSEKAKTADKTKNIPLWYAVSIGFIILGIAVLSVKYLWIYYYGYVFLILGVTGLLIKYFIIDAGKKE